MNDSYGTPGYLYQALNSEFHFSLDPCPLNPEWKVNGLGLNWDGETVFVNPPWSDILPWVRKAYVSKNCVTVFLWKSRTGTEWFHMLRNRGAEIRFFRERIQFVKEYVRKSPPEDVLVAIVRLRKSDCGPKALNMQAVDQKY